jgi:hypothetical protein
MIGRVPSRAIAWSGRFGINNPGNAASLPATAGSIRRNCSAVRPEIPARSRTSSRDDTEFGID